MQPAMSQCESQNGIGNCDLVWGVLAVKKCPLGYIRYGCCTCVKPCPRGFYDNGEICRKEGESVIKYYPTLNACRVDNPKRKYDCELWGQDKYVLNCKSGLTAKNGRCIRKCPGIWPEINKKWCMKVATIRVPLYYEWKIIYKQKNGKKIDITNINNVNIQNIPKIKVENKK